MIMQSDILNRNGWSKTLVKKLLGEPDAKKKMQGRANLLCLYELSRVLLVESSVEFISAQDLLTKRRKSAEKAVKTKTDKLMSEVELMNVFISKVDTSKMQSLAIKSYNVRNYLSDNQATFNSDKSFLDRICVNFIRHSLTHYDENLETLARKTGKSEAIDIIRDKIYNGIALAYPKYTTECNRHRNERLLEG